jgi:hypothetical protein
MAACCSLLINATLQALMQEAGIQLRYCCWSLPLITSLHAAGSQPQLSSQPHSWPSQAHAFTSPPNT